MRQRVLFSEQTPDAVSEVGTIVVKLNGFHLGKLFNQGFVDDKLLVAILSRRLVLMLADALLQKLRHPEMGIA